MKASELALNQFLRRYREFIAEAIPKLENYLGTGLVDDDRLESLLRG